MLDRIELIAPCHFGMESVLKKEIFDLGYEVTRVSDGRVYFEGDRNRWCIYKQSSSDDKRQPCKGCRKMCAYKRK